MHPEASRPQASLCSPSPHSHTRTEEKGDGWAPLQLPTSPWHSLPPPLHIMRLSYVYARCSRHERIGAEWVRSTHKLAYMGKLG